MTSIRTQVLELQNITFDNIPILLTHIPAPIPRYIGFSTTSSPIPKQNSQKPTMSCRMANVLATLSTMFTYHPRSADVTVERAHHAAIPDKSVWTWSKLSPLPLPSHPHPHPTFNDNQLLLLFFLTFCWRKRDLFQKRLGGMEDTWCSSWVPITFGRDYLKEICEKFPNEGNASDCRGVTIF